MKIEEAEEEDNGVNGRYIFMHYHEINFFGTKLSLFFLCQDIMTFKDFYKFADKVVPYKEYTP